jgi:c-di-AMP phosphodiesterase-like protein
MDALGACLGVKAIADHLGKESRIIIDFKKTETKTRSALTSSFGKEELENIRIHPRDVHEFIKNNQNDTLLIVCDVHIPDMVMDMNVLDKVSKIVVIDHHRRKEQYIDSPVLNHIDTAASSTCELIAEIIKFASVNPKINLPAQYATIMLSGIFLDSQYFKSKHTGIRTFEACTTLKEYGADNSIADDFLKDDKEEYFTITSIVKNIKFPAPGVACCVADPESEFEIADLAKAANTCLNMRSVKAAFVIGKAEKRIRISCRSDGSVNVQILAEKLGGGGHMTIAGAQIEGSTIEEVVGNLKGIIDNYLE